MFNIFKRKSKNVNIENNQILVINSKKYLVGFALFSDDITLHCLDKLYDVKEVSKYEKTK